MCRLLGAVAVSPRTPRELLDSQFGPFLEMSTKHRDGWGAAWWGDSPPPQVAKAPEQALGSTDFAELCDTQTTDGLIVHLRLASPGMPNLPGNTHPFALGDVAFAHNGYAWPNDALDDLLRAAEATPPEGGTDSERYFHLVLAHLRDADPVEAIGRAAGAIADRCEFISLNSLLLTPNALYALEYWDPPQVAARSYDDDMFTLRYRTTEQEVMVASSGWEQPESEWTRLGNGRLLEMTRSNLRTRVHDLLPPRDSAA